jgi:hypothetical protein
MEELIRRIEDLKGSIQRTFDEQWGHMASSTDPVALVDTLNGHIARMMEVLADILGVVNEAQKLLTEGKPNDEA